MHTYYLACTALALGFLFGIEYTVDPDLVEVDDEYNGLEILYMEAPSEEEKLEWIGPYSMKLSI